MSGRSPWTRAATLLGGIHRIPLRPSSPLGEPNPIAYDRHPSAPALVVVNEPNCHEMSTERTQATSLDYQVVWLEGHPAIDADQRLLVQSSTTAMSSTYSNDSGSDSPTSYR